VKGNRLAVGESQALAGGWFQRLTLAFFADLVRSSGCDSIGPNEERT